MFTKHDIRKAAIGLVNAVLLFSLLSHYALADYMTSSSFSSDQNGFTTLGGYSSSPSFSSFGSIDPAADGNSTSTSYNQSSGYLQTTDSSTFASQNWQWFDDAFDDTPSIPFADQNVAPSNIQYNDPFKLRITVKNVTATDAQNVKLRLQYATTSDFTSGATYVGEQGTCSTSVIFCYAPGGGADNAVIQDIVLSDPNFCGGGVGVGCGTYNKSGTTTSTYYHYAGKKAEYDFTIKQRYGDEGIVYFFRLVDASTGVPVPTNTGATYPSLMINGSSFSFTINGVTSGTSTEGETTDVATSPTAVDFGTLPIGAAKVAAQRLIVTTNASSGYKVYAYQRQAFLNSSAHEIPPIDSTNAVPTDWTTACAATSTGCYGYHAGSPVLEGGSTRFAADDTFAKFTSAPDEVAYGAGSAPGGAATDIVYKVLARDLQDSGDYSTSIVYIATPVY